SWYQPYSDTAHLPLFAQLQNPGAKSAGAFIVRMETPVLYFYPESETDVTVNVSFADGMITERFPPSQFNVAEYQTPSTRKSDAPPVTTWKGKLLPPGHPMAASIPPVPEGTVENYAAARAVPDAWLFASSTPVIRMKDQPDIHPVDKFIFYRGASRTSPPWRATLDEDRTFTLTRMDQTAERWAVALQVRNGMASWKPLEKDSDDLSRTTLPKPDKPVEQAIAELGEVFLNELTARGLTRDEALAMIRTWDGTWFSEEGQRIFTIADPDWVDRQLPLEITPKPENTSRVFVVRCELLDPQTEKQLAAILLNPDANSAERLNDLRLGRFGKGAVEIAAETVRSTMHANHNSLLSKMAETEPIHTTSRWTK
ncbi:MAG TPA: hypothetical protein VLO11_13805, partial [Luteolibacter sp.]|nr:hypothetical protein [Luteolibacter sp.]